MDTSNFNENLIKAKEQKAKKGGLTEHGREKAERGRLPPGQYLTGKWPILDLGVRPEIPLKDWRLEVTGLVERSLVLDWESFMELPQSLVTADMHCVTAWSRFDNGWQGVKVLDLIKQVRPSPKAKFTFQYGYDGYVTNTPLEELLKDNVIIAHSHDGQPLTKEHGGPARMVIPELYAWKGSKFLSKIVFVEKDEPGFWEQRGYHSRGDPWKEERYS